MKRIMQVTIEIAVGLDETEIRIAEAVQEQLGQDRWVGEDWIINNMGVYDTGVILDEKDL